jgi:ABC-type Fe3+ transport system permease subunit/sugar lactone lactonase YvrE
MKLTWFRAGLLGRTVLYNGAAAVLATLMALPAALVVGRGRGWTVWAIMLILPLALIMPSISYTYGWLQFFRLMGVSFEPAGLADVLRCIWTLAGWLWPLPAIAVGLSLRFMNSQVQQQGILDGALWRVTLRQLAGPVLSSTAVVLVLAMQEFGVYERSGISVVATEVRTVFETGAFSQRDPSVIAGVVAGSGLAKDSQAQRAAEAAATALPLLAIIAVLTLAALWAALRMSAAEAVDVPQWPAVLDAGWPATLTTFGLIIVTLVVPVAAMAASISPQRWQTDESGHWAPIRIWLWAQPYTAGSLLYGGLTGAAALGIGLLACVRGSRWLLAGALAAFLIGGELLAIADIRIYNRAAPWPLSGVRVSGHDLFGLIYNNVPVMVIAYVGRFAWLALLAGNATWSRPFRELRDVAAVDGAGPWRTACDVIWPIAWPILAAAAALVIILSMTEVSASVLLSPQRPQMLIVTLMGWVHMLRYDDMLEGSLLLMAMVFLLGLGCVMLAWLGIRFTGTLRRAASRGVLPAALLLLVMGCDDGTRPQAIWCETGPARGQLIYPRGIAYSRKDDCFFVVDRTARIQRIERDGSASAQWRMPQWESGKPVGLSVGPDGNVYVADTHYSRVVVYSPRGEHLRQWGGVGREPGQFFYPTDVAFDSQGNVYVSEYGDNDRIQVFDPTGRRVLRIIGKFGQGDGEFCRPQSMVIDSELIYVTDSCNHRIAVFKTDGSFVRNMGRVGTGLGQFRFPYGLDEDSRGHLVVAEFGNNRVQMIDRQTGRGIRTWGVAGRDPGQLAYPWAAAVDKRDRVVVVDSGNNRLQVFR